MENIAIFGAGTMAHTYIDIIESTKKYNIVGFFDDRYPKLDCCNEFKVLGATKDLASKCKELDIKNIVVCIGDNYVRSIVVENIKKEVPDILFPSVIHKNAYVSPRANIGEGVVIMPLVLIDAGVTLEDFTFIGGGSIIPHNSHLEEYSSVSAGVAVGGEFKLAKFSYVGIGAKIFHCITVGENTIVGAGSIVTKDIPSNCVAYGAPAKIVRTRKLGEKYL